ncbi:MAG TPA: PKD domain-containing protein [Verrucomicrobiae bacterium]|nr:PKD domain-containing protein [Verrucomicrobiae bacterium]
MTAIARRTTTFVIGSLLLLSASSGANTYYVATNGNDTASGTSTNTPWRTPERGIASVTAGDTLYVRGGTYMLTNQVKTAKAGTAANYCNLWAYPGEHPFFNATNLASGNRGIYISKDFWYVKGIEVGFAPDNGIIIGSGSNIIEGCVIHDNQNDGMTLGSTTVQAHHNLILNCDSYRNFQASSGGNNGDGYSAKQGCGVSNVFQGCRSYLNSDDGWDFYDNNSNTVTLLNCWSFMNGSNQWNVGSFSGNGNGFKLGGAGTHAGHVLKQCLAFYNHSKGFDHNLGVGAHTLYNCTGFGNVNPNFSFYDAPASGTDVFKNDISYMSGSTNIYGINIVPGSTMVSNSWQNGLTVSSNDFASLDVSLAFAARNSDYSLPTNNFARLAAGSHLIDAGVDVGLPYNGSAPDLGAYEFVPSSSSSAAVAGFTVSPTNGVEPLAVAFSDTSTGTPPLSLSWDLGDGFATNTAGGANFVHSYAAGTYTVTLTASNSAGTSTLVSNNLIVVTPAIQAAAAGFTVSPTNGVEPLAVTFSDTSTGTPPLSLSWDLGDGFTTNTAGGAVLVHSYAAGTYTVSLTASNSAGTSTIVSSNLIGVVTVFQAWQLQYFGCTDCSQADPDADPYGKGMSNTNQFLAGLNPTNPASIFRITSIVADSSNNVVITWSTAGGHTNAVQASAGDGSGNYASSFNSIGDPIIIPGASDTTTNYVDAGGATNTPARYYRVRLVP